MRAYLRRMQQAHALAATEHRPATRLAYLDAIRGVLWCCVLADHAAQFAFRTMALEMIGQVAWVIWRTVEQPSITMSRRVAEEQLRILFL